MVVELGGKTGLYSRLGLPSESESPSDGEQTSQPRRWDGS